MRRAILTAAVVATIAGCGAPAKIQPEYTGCGSDEQWLTFDAHEPNAVVDDSMAPVVTAPALSQPLAFANKPTFQWSQDPASVGMPTGDVIYLDGPGCQGCCPEFSSGALTTLHLPPISGNEYDLQFYQGGNLVHRLITTLQEWAPDDGLWATWRGQSITLKMYRQTVLTNDLKAGPFTNLESPSPSVSGASAGSHRRSRHRAAVLLAAPFGRRRAIAVAVARLRATQTVLLERLTRGARRAIRARIARAEERAERGVDGSRRVFRQRNRRCRQQRDREQGRDDPPDSRTNCLHDWPPRIRNAESVPTEFRRGSLTQSE